MPIIEYDNQPGQPLKVEIDGERFVAESSYIEVLRQLDQLSARLSKKQRSAASHGHYFAEVRHLWQTMPEALASLPYAKSEDHFRKHALIEVGYGDTQIVDCEDRAAAMKAAPLIADLARKADGYAIVTVKGTLITCTTARSQDYDSMPKDDFEKSKNLVLDWMHQKIGAAR